MKPKQSHRHSFFLITFYIINYASYIVGNDSAPAHICSHLNKNGLVLFGSHTSPEKVSVGSKNFQSLQVKNLNELKVGTVFEKIKSKLDQV